MVNNENVLPQRVLGMVLTASEAEQTPSASLQRMAKLFRWRWKIWILWWSVKWFCVAMPCIAMQGITTQRVRMQCYVLQCSALQCSSMLCITMQCITMQCVMMQCITVQCFAMRCITMCFNAVYSVHYCKGFDKEIVKRATSVLCSKKQQQGLKS